MNHSIKLQTTDSKLSSQIPNGAFTYFVSQNWEQRKHPDNDEGTKLAWLKNLKGHLRIGSDRELYVWFDIYSIPQRNRVDQTKAISSLPRYTQLCTRILPLVRDARRWEELYNKPASVLYDNGPPRGDVNTYFDRGWCRLELLCALCPKKFSNNTWRPGPLALRVIFHEEPENTQSPTLGPRLTAAQHLLDPLDPKLTYTCCVFAKEDGTLDTHDCDRFHVYYVREVVAERYLEYVESGATEWNKTLDFNTLPEWLIQAGKKGKDNAVATGGSCWRKAGKKGKDDAAPETRRRLTHQPPYFDAEVQLNEIKIDDSPSDGGAEQKVEQTKSVQS